MFGIIKDMGIRVATLDEDAILQKIFDDPELQSKIVLLNQQQLQSGKGSDGSSLPRYQDDPYFKTTKAAKAYEAWKSHISPNPDKPPGVMDFYIDGTFQSTLKVVNAAKEFKVTSDSAIAGDVQDKTGGEAFGLNDDSLNVIILQILDVFRMEVYKTIWAK